MTQEEIKNLLLQDISARLSYGVIISVIDIDGFKFEGELRVISNGWCKLKISDSRKRVRVKNEIIPLNSVYIRPYLRPMSNMTEEERKEYHNLCYEEEREQREFGEWVTRVYYHDTIESIDWLNAHHFDYRGLIPNGLAKVAPEGMYESVDKHL